MAEARKMERILTEVEIKSLLVRERYYRDTQQWGKLRGCYHPDASQTNINITWYQGDVDGFVAGSEKMAQRSQASSSHTICPVEVHLKGDKAVSESIGTILARFQHKGTMYDCISHGRFISRLRKVSEEWKLLTLEVIYDKDMIQAIVPNGHSEDIELDLNARASYRCLAWVLSANGFSINQKLPGTDLPGSEAELMGACFGWLRGQDSKTAAT